MPFISCIDIWGFLHSSSPYPSPTSPPLSVYQAYLSFLIAAINLMCTKAQSRASLVAQLVKNPPAMQETPLRFLDQEVSLEKG